MVWRISYAQTAMQQLRKLDRSVAARLLKYMDERIAVQDDPRRLGKALSGPMGDLWRYRVGDFRVVCHIQDNELCVLVVRIGNRKDVYKNK